MRSQAHHQQAAYQRSAAGRSGSVGGCSDWVLGGLGGEDRMRVNAIARLGSRNLQLARGTVGVGWRAALTAPAVALVWATAGTAKELLGPHPAVSPAPENLRSEQRTTFLCGRPSVAQYRENRTEILLVFVLNRRKRSSALQRYRRCESHIC